MSAFPFTITTTPPGSLKLKTGENGTFSFTITSLAAPDKTYDLELLPLVFNEEGKSKEVDWLVAGPHETLSMAGGKTETVTVTARPTVSSQRGEHTIRLRVAKKDDTNEYYIDSPPVTCEVLAAPAEDKGGSKRPGWLIPVIVAGAVLLLGAGAVVVWQLMKDKHGLGDPCDADGHCDGELICGTGKQCLLAGGAACQAAQAPLCASGECRSNPAVCAIPLGGACNPDGTTGALCVQRSVCDRATGTCASEQPACTAGALQCTADGTAVQSCEAGHWKTSACPKGAPQCRDAKCQCLAKPNEACGLCEGTVQCDGLFALGRALTAWDQPETDWSGFTLHVADVNGDRRADLIWNGLTPSNRTFVALSNPDGTFRRALTAWDQPETGWATYKLHVADVNDDRRADLIWNELSTGNRTYVALSNGNGTFRRALTAWDQPEGGWSGYALHVADVNDDRRADLVWNALTTSNRTFVALSNGDGTFRRALTAWDQPESGWSASALSVADMNGDRRADLIWNELGAINRTFIALSNGDGTFRRVVTAWDQPERAWSGYRLYVADVNGDGRVDLLWNNLATGNRTHLAQSTGGP